mgnify:CR=1 FL=1
MDFVIPDISVSEELLFQIQLMEQQEMSVNQEDIVILDLINQLHVLQAHSIQTLEPNQKQIVLPVLLDTTAQDLTLELPLMDILMKLVNAMQVITVTVEQHLNINILLLKVITHFLGLLKKLLVLSRSITHILLKVLV